MSLSAFDKIKLKTKQILVKTDDYLRESNTFGPKASMHGMAFGATAVMAGIVGVMAIVAAPALPVLAGVAAVAAMPTALTIGGASISLAGASLIGGGAAGIAFAGIAKIYNNIRGSNNQHVQGEFECIVRDRATNPSIENDKVFNNIDLNKVVKVDRKTILKSIENGTFHDKYVGIRVNGVNHEHAYHKIPEGMVLEEAAAIPFKYGTKEIKVTNGEWKEDCKTIRRECFKEAKSFDLKAKILNRISAFREEVEGKKMTSKYNV